MGQLEQLLQINNTPTFVWCLFFAGILSLTIGLIGMYNENRNK